MARPRKKIKDKFKRVTLTISPEAFKYLRKKTNKSDYVDTLILRREAGNVA